MTKTYIAQPKIIGILIDNICEIEEDNKRLQAVINKLAEEPKGDSTEDLYARIELAREAQGEIGF